MQRPTLTPVLVYLVDTLNSVQAERGSGAVRQKRVRMKPDPAAAAGRSCAAVDRNWTTVRCTNCDRWIKVPMEASINGAATCSWCGLPTAVEERKGGPLADTV